MELLAPTQPLLNWGAGAALEVLVTGHPSSHYAVSFGSGHLLLQGHVCSALPYVWEGRGDKAAGEVGRQARLQFVMWLVHSATRSLLTRCHCEAGFCCIRWDRCWGGCWALGRPCQEQGKGTEEVSRANGALLLVFPNLGKMQEGFLEHSSIITPLNTPAFTCVWISVNQPPWLSHLLLVVMQVWQQAPSSHSALDHCSLSPSAASLPYALCESPSLPWLQHNSLQQMAALQHGCKERTVAHAFISSFTSFLFSSFHFFFPSFSRCFLLPIFFSSRLLSLQALASPTRINDFWVEDNSAWAYISCSWLPALEFLYIIRPALFLLLLLLSFSLLFPYPFPSPSGLSKMLEWKYQPCPFLPKMV